jgi:hypothetical protein
VLSGVIHSSTGTLLTGRAQLEEAIGKLVQTQPSGNVETKQTKFGEVSSIVPHVKIGYVVGEGYYLQPSI